VAGQGLWRTVAQQPPKNLSEAKILSFLVKVKVKVCHYVATQFHRPLNVRSTAVQRPLAGRVASVRAFVQLPMPSRRRFVAQCSAQPWLIQRRSARDAGAH
jgi:hypothetical protein